MAELVDEAFKATVGRRPQIFPTYTVDDDALAMGASLGNSAIWVNLKGTGAIERVFHAQIGESLFGAVSIRYGLTSQSLQAPWKHPAVAEEQPFIAIDADGPGTVELHPAYQRHHFTLARTVNVTETTFVPLSENITCGNDLPAAFQCVELLNAGDAVHSLRIMGFARLRGTLAADVSARYEPEVRALVVRGARHRNAVRCYGLSCLPTKFATTSDFGRAYDPVHLHPLRNETNDCGDILGALQLDIALRPGEAISFAFMCAVYDEPEALALEHFRTLPTPDDLLAKTLGYLEDTLHTSEVLTPSRDLNDGVLWSKVNMRRVMMQYQQGQAFTNEPGISSNVVGRDAAWFVYGNDYFIPSFSRALLENFARAQYADGKVPEYYNAIDGSVEDYGLNINDTTPLFILAVNHHVRATGDLEWLRKIYASVANSARYIISQIDERGLVYCSARDPRGNVWAIAGWRNVIPGYSLNGAVTEINAECAAALRAAAHLADDAGVGVPDAINFRTESQNIQRAMDTHLRNPENGLYYLNIDVDGTVHTDVTGDQIFPVMFRVCDDETGFRIISRLNSRDFTTHAGLRTASRNDPLYDPAGNIGLLGGIWPGLTWWYAFSAGRYHPEFMVRALRNSFGHYAADPKKNNTVPGQFSEYFDGESLINRGMRLSPWEPPRFLWATVEGVCGLTLSTGAARINPLIPETWKWIALKRLPFHGQEITYFAVRECGTFQIYANREVESEFKMERFDEDVSSRVCVFSENAAVVALQRCDATVLLVGNVGIQTETVPLNIASLLEPLAVYEVRIYNSQRDAWEPAQSGKGGKFGAIALSIEAHGYCLVELRNGR
jgi:hypothetical protein